jgi:hypothetical protein
MLVKSAHEWGSLSSNDTGYMGLPEHTAYLLVTDSMSTDPRDDCVINVVPSVLSLCSALVLEYHNWACLFLAGGRKSTWQLST